MAETKEPAVVKRGPGRPKGSGKRGPGRPKGAGKRGPGRPKGTAKPGPGRPKGAGKVGRPKGSRIASKGVVGALVAKQVKAALKQYRSDLKDQVRSLVAKE